jgi:hypothetical protein
MTNITIKASDAYLSCKKPGDTKPTKMKIGNKSIAFSGQHIVAHDTDTFRLLDGYKKNDCNIEYANGKKEKLDNILSIRGDDKQIDILALYINKENNAVDNLLNDTNTTDDTRLSGQVLDKMTFNKKGQITTTRTGVEGVQEGTVTTDLTEVSGQVVDDMSFKKTGKITTTTTGQASETYIEILTTTDIEEAMEITGEKITPKMIEKLFNETKTEGNLLNNIDTTDDTPGLKLPRNIHGEYLDTTPELHKLKRNELQRILDKHFPDNI